MVQVNVNTEHKIKVAQRWSWLFMGIAVISLFFNLLLVLTMYQMGSRLTVMSQLFNTTRGTDTMFYSDTLNYNLSDLNTLEWSFVQRYVEEKNFVIPEKKEMERRWGPFGDVAMMSLPRIFPPVFRYDDERIKNLEDSFPMHADNIKFLSRTGHNWNVSFDLWTHGPNGSSRIRKNANITVGFSRSRRQKNAISGHYFNPLGMVVTDYTATTVD